LHAGSGDLVGIGVPPPMDWQSQPSVAQALTSAVKSLAVRQPVAFEHFM
jgi:hypothetical protein